MRKFRKGDPIEFLRKKDYLFISDIGQGGTGKTILLQDEIINERFICKKYSPFYEDTPTEFFNYFKSEIKLLHLAYHRNIVRVFNYYLYPADHTGYILMEYIEGEKIDSYVRRNPHEIDSIFEQVISGFEYLESLKILHRDIRPENILVSKNGVVKIIDFGFSKKIDFENEPYNKSVSLNWRYDKPQEFQESIYDFRTEVFFIGKLFEEIINKNSPVNFRYIETLQSMTIDNYENRIESFFNIRRRLTNKSLGSTISQKDKEVYLDFADSLLKVISRIDPDSKYETDLDHIISGLGSLYQNSQLEEFLFNRTSLPNCFIIGNYSYYKNEIFYVSTLKNFIDLLQSFTTDKRQVILNNLWQRFDSIKESPPEIEDSDDLPF